MKTPTSQEFSICCNAKINSFGLCIGCGDHAEDYLPELQKLEKIARRRIEMKHIFGRRKGKYICTNCGVSEHLVSQGEWCSSNEHTGAIPFEDADGEPITQYVMPDGSLSDLPYREPSVEYTGPTYGEIAVAALVVFGIIIFGWGLQIAEVAK